MERAYDRADPHGTAGACRALNRNVLGKWRFLTVALSTVLLFAFSSGAGAVQDGVLSFMSSTQEAEMVVAMHPRVLREHSGEIDDPRLSAYVAGVGARIVLQSASAGERFKFTVLNSPEPNAFTAGGGYVYITRGMLALLGSEAELASILGHEIGHVVARHSARRQSKVQLLHQGASPYLGGSGASGISQTRRDYLGTYSRQQEYEADGLGVNYTARAGYDPFALAKGLAGTGQFTTTMLRLSGRSSAEFGASSTHPSTPERVRRAVQIAAATRIKSGTRPRYEKRSLAAIDGLPMGPAPGQGRLVGRRYFQPIPGLAFDVPKGFRAAVKAGQFVAQGPSGAQITFDESKVAPGTATRKHVEMVWKKSAHVSFHRQHVVSGMKAVEGVATLRQKGGAGPVYFAAIRFSPDAVYHLMLQAPKDDSGAREALEATIQSFRKTAASEAPARRTMRLRVHTIKSDQSAEEVSSLMQTADHKLDIFLALNAVPKKARLKAGDQVKLLRLE